MNLTHVPAFLVSSLILLSITVAPGRVCAQSFDLEECSTEEQECRDACNKSYDSCISRTGVSSSSSSSSNICFDRRSNCRDQCIDCGAIQEQEDVFDTSRLRIQRLCDDVIMPILEPLQLRVPIYERGNTGGSLLFQDTSCVLDGCGPRSLGASATPMVWCRYCIDDLPLEHVSNQKGDQRYFMPGDYDVQIVQEEEEEEARNQTTTKLILKTSGPKNGIKQKELNRTTYTEIITLEEGGDKGNKSQAAASGGGSARCESEMEWFPFDDSAEKVEIDCGCQMISCSNDDTLSTAITYDCSQPPSGPVDKMDTYSLPLPVWNSCPTDNNANNQQQYSNVALIDAPCEVGCNLRYNIPCRDYVEAEDGASTSTDDDDDDNNNDGSSDDDSAGSSLSASYLLGCHIALLLIWWV